MSTFAAALTSLVRRFLPTHRPYRIVAARRMHFFAAIAAGGAAGLVFLILYYATLGLLPSAFEYPVTAYPFPAWAERFDLAQFLGTLFRPPLPTPFTWWLGLVLLFGILAGGGVIYALLLSWTLQHSEAKKGAGFGFALFVGLAFIITVANGLHPAIMRNALPDTGLFLIGWSIWATLQLLLVYVVYGAILGGLYDRWSR